MVIGCINGWTLPRKAEEIPYGTIGDMDVMRWSMLFALGAAMIPIAGSSAFVPAGLTTTCRRSPTSAANMRSLNPPGNPPKVVFPMKAVQDSCKGMRDDAAITPGDRAHFVKRAAWVAAAVVAGAEGVGMSPAAADSTGKFSSKATARKRYLPRIAKLVREFQQLKKEIAEGSASSTSPFFVEILSDAIPAMELFGSSMKRGEYPDSTSKGLQKLADDFSTASKAIGKSLGKEGGAEDAARAYEKASAILADYLNGSKLDPMDSDTYN